MIGGTKHTFHLIPSGALKGKELLIGAGVAVDPVVLGEELSLLPVEIRRMLLVDGRCSVVSPAEKEFDRFVEALRGRGAIGTTGRGIGPSYAVRALRLSPRALDLMGDFDFGPLEKFYEKIGVATTGLREWQAHAKRILAGMVGDVAGRIVELTEMGGSVLFEASQGSLLDILHGSYPFVTGTHTTTSYLPSGLGIEPALAGVSLGVTKCYTTRVGGGPFPTEITGPLAENIRGLGNEYGATTGRPRRVGWLDLVALKYALKLNGSKSIAISKLDILSQIREMKVCVAYRHLGSENTDFLKSLGNLEKVEPVYETPPSLSGAKFDRGLSTEGKRFVEYLEKEVNVKVTLVSYGEERSKTIEL